MKDKDKDKDKDKNRDTPLSETPEVSKVTDLKTALADIEKRSILIEYKLSLMDTAKISAMSAVISIPMLEIIKMVLTALTHQP